MSSSTNNNNIKEKVTNSGIDQYIEKLLNFKFLAESELKEICDKVN